MLILTHRNHKALLPINHLRLDLRCLLRLHAQYHIIRLCLSDIIVDFFLLFNELGGTLRKRLILFIKLHGQCADLILKCHFFHTQFILHKRLGVDHILCCRRFLAKCLIHRLFDLCSLFLADITVCKKLCDYFLIEQESIFVIVVCLGIFIDHIT